MGAYLDGTGLGKILSVIKSWAESVFAPKTHSHSQYLTSHQTLYEANTYWGGRSIAGDISPIDAACTDEMGHNKLAFLPGSCITVEYTTDGGNTWIDYEVPDAQKIALVSTTGPSLYIGKNIANVTNGLLTADTCTKYGLRIKISSRDSNGTGRIYTSLKKILINISTQGATGAWCKVERRTIADYNNNVDNWIVMGTYNISGWSGWNSIPYLTTFGGGTTQTTNPSADIRFTFGITGVHATYASAMSVSDIRFIGTTNWAYPSEMARAGHLYSVDTAQSANFPNHIIPINNGTQNLGTSDKKWNNIYANTIYGTVDQSTSSAKLRQYSIDGSGALDNFLEANVVKTGRFTNVSEVGFASNDGMVISLPWTSNTYGAQIAFDDHNTNPKMVFRGKNQTWGPWKVVLHDGNYNSYVPKLDGTGATGTWGINISGTASDANILKYTHGNEVNFAGNAPSSVHINYRDGATDATATTAITDYYLDNGKGKTDGVTVHAENFSGKINNHNVLSDVPANAVFTDTIVDISGKQDKITSSNKLDYSLISGTPNLSKGTTSGSGNAVTDISVSGHTVTLTKGTTFVDISSGQSISNKDISSGYLNTHPENGPILVPFLNNDIAFLTSRGGTVKIYKDGTLLNNSSYNVGNMFDGSPSYCNIGMSGATTLVIELTLPTYYGWSSVFYIDFGASNWRAKRISVDVMNSQYANDVWMNKQSTTSNALGHWRCGLNHTPVGGNSAGNGFDKIRITLSDFNSTDFRISQIGIMNYGSYGSRNTYMSRGIDDNVYRSITPASNNTYALGSSSNKWSAVYAGSFNGYTIGASVPSDAKFTDTIVDISGKQDKITSSNKLDYSLLSGTPTIPSAVTESTVSGWGFTKNSGTYSKPSGGIPKTDLAAAVQTSLGLADTALQSHQDISGKQDKITATNKLSYTLLTDTPSIPSAVSKQTVTDWGFVQIVVVAFSGGAYGGSSDTGTVSFKTFAGAITRAQFLNMITTDNAVILVDSVSGNVMASEIAYDVDTGNVTVVALRDGASYKFVINSSSRYTRTITSFSSGGGSAGVDYIVEQGTTGMWTYEKWNSGKLVQYGNASYNGKLNTSQAGGYSSASLSVDNYPIAFVGEPVVTNGCYCANDSAAIVVIYPSATPNVGIGHYRLWRGNSQGTTYTYTVSFEAKGKWK